MIGRVWRERYGGVRFLLLDLAVLTYVLTTGLVLALFGDGVAHRNARVLAHLLVAAAVLELLRAAQARRGGSGAWRWARALYAVPIFGAAWGELNLLVPLLYDGSYWATHLVVGADLLLAGGHPTVLVQALHRPWLDELMAVFYTGYYLFPTVPVVLLALRREREALAAGSLIALTYASNFLLFLLLPAKSPPQLLSVYPDLLPSHYTGYWVAALTRTIQNNESVLGAAFPSSHVSASLVCALAARRYLPGFGRVLLPLAFGVAVATVYLGYHHMLDPIAGLAWGWLCYRGGLRWLRLRGEDPLA